MTIPAMWSNITEQIEQGTWVENIHEYISLRVVPKSQIDPDLLGIVFFNITNFTASSMTLNVTFAHPFQISFDPLETDMLELEIL